MNPHDSHNPQEPQASSEGPALKQPPPVHYLHGKSSQDDATLAMLQASWFWHQLSSSWIMRLYESSQVILSCPPFSQSERELFSAQGKFPLRYVILQAERERIRMIMALDGLMTSAMHTPHLAPSYVVSAQSIIRSMRDRMAIVDDFVHGDEGITSEEDRNGYALNRKMWQDTLGVCEHHIRNIQQVSLDVRKHRINMPVPVDPVIGHKINPMRMMPPAQGPPPGAGS